MLFSGCVVLILRLFMAKTKPISTSPYFSSYRFFCSVRQQGVSQWISQTHQLCWSGIIQPHAHAMGHHALKSASCRINSPHRPPEAVTTQELENAGEGGGEGASLGFLCLRHLHVQLWRELGRCRFLRPRRGWS